jgi:phospholipid/cholesterol/gamma-HCH transport system permease protein
MAATAEMTVKQTSADTLLLALSGSWKLGEALPSAADIQKRLEEAGGIEAIAFDTRKLAGWDTGLLAFLQRLRRLCEDNRVRIDSGGLPKGARQLLALAATVPEKKDARKPYERQPFLAMVGDETADFFASTGRLLAFIGETTLALGRLLRGRAAFRRTDLWLILESCGGQALPIVSLISFLVGLILAFVGAIQLVLFGAQIYVADLVGIAMVRLMAAVMTGPKTGAQAKTEYRNGILAFVPRKGGLMAGLSVGGQKFSFEAQ